MAVSKSVGTSTSDLVVIAASVVTCIVSALLIAGASVVKHDGRSP